MTWGWNCEILYHDDDTNLGACLCLLHGEVMIVQIVKCVMVSLIWLIQILTLGLFLTFSWYSCRGVLRIISIIFTAICFAGCMAIGIWTLM
nr:MAG TPA: hypothetical protein [Caudoviricetes sp.]